MSRALIAVLVVFAAPASAFLGGRAARGSPALLRSTRDSFSAEAAGASAPAGEMTVRGRFDAQECERKGIESIIMLKRSFGLDWQVDLCMPACSTKLSKNPHPKTHRLNRVSFLQVGEGVISNVWELDCYSRPVTVAGKKLWVSPVAA